MKLIPSWTAQFCRNLLTCTDVKDSASRIFNCYNISICEKEKLKDETSEKIRETNEGLIEEQDVPLT